MHYYVGDARIHCTCIESSDKRSLHSVSKMYFCPTCKIKRCFLCTLHSPSNKICLRCERNYNVQDTHCYRCYTCPECDKDLESYPLLYKHKIGGTETEFELIKSKHDKSRIAGKAVHFKCPDSDCRFKYTTNVETKPQSLQQIVQHNIKDNRDVRYSELMEYYDWCLNYQRILDKKQRSKWKTEILKKFESFEVAKILQDESSLLQVVDKERATVRPIMDTVSAQLFPQPKVLHTVMKEICPTCLEGLSCREMTSKLPLIYALPMVGYPSFKLKELREGERVDVPILVSFVNNSESEMCVNIIEDGVTTFLPPSSANCIVIPTVDPSTQPSTDKLSTVPTCLLSNVSKKEGNWKTELERRDPKSLARLRYVEGSNIDELKNVVDSGANWITLLLIVRVTGDRESRNGKIKFALNISLDTQGSDVRNAEYHCCALV